mmetsp:Transcript_46664/g.113702  ORF Transcript_46664/g.113702 Transcript_46664/m.113702 type:complete len:306 (+) Transcript_46664:1193-2110(+)
MSSSSPSLSSSIAPCSSSVPNRSWNHSTSSFHSCPTKSLSVLSNLSITKQNPSYLKSGLPRVEFLWIGKKALMPLEVQPFNWMMLGWPYPYDDDVNALRIIPSLTRSADPVAIFSTLADGLDICPLKVFKTTLSRGFLRILNGKPLSCPKDLISYTAWNCPCPNAIPNSIVSYMSPPPKISVMVFVLGAVAAAAAAAAPDVDELFVPSFFFCLRFSSSAISWSSCSIPARFNRSVANFLMTCPRSLLLFWPLLFLTAASRSGLEGVSVMVFALAIRLALLFLLLVLLSAGDRCCTAKAAAAFCFC